MDEDRYWLLMSKYLANDITLEETDELLKWVDEKPERLELLQQLQGSLEKTAVYNEVDYAFDTDIAWEKVSARIDNSLPVPKDNVAYLKWLRFAAIFLIFLSLGWFGVNYYNDYKLIVIENHQLTAKEIILPDGSHVWLNQHSKLSYRNGINKLDERRVDLSGEAFFDVQKNPEKPFVIENASTETRVLGTSFNVKNLNGIITVSVFTGKVSFKERNSTHELVLLPGEEGVFSKSGGLVKSNYEDKNFMFWKDQNLDFSNEKLADVLPTISAVYAVEFQLENPGLGEKRITTSFHKLSLPEVKDVLEIILETKIEKAGNVYVVK